MNSEKSTTEKICPRQELCLYVDGELSPKDEILLEKHLADCQLCRNELNLQKQMLSALNFAFDKRKEIDLPEDFTKIVVTQAESRVSGLRSKDERFRAFYLVLALFLLLAIGFVAESQKFSSVLFGLGGQILVIGSFLIHSIYDFSIGLAVILRSLSQKAFFSPGFIFLLLTSVLLLALIILPKFSRTRAG